MLRVSDLRHKDIVNVMDGRRLGFIRDVDIDVQGGKIRSVVVPGEAGFFSFFTRGDDTVIPWAQIKRIGVDVILVELERVTPARRFARRERREEQEEHEEREAKLVDGLPLGPAAPLDYEREMEDMLQKEWRRA